MEFPNRVKCIEHYQSQFPHLPRYMIEMALDHDLQNGATTNEKPKTSKEKRKEKKFKEGQGKRDTSVADNIKAGEIQMDCVKVVPQEDYIMAPFVAGYISLDGMDEVEDEVEKSEDN